MKLLLGLGVQVLGPGKIDLVDDDEGKLVGEQGLAVGLLVIAQYRQGFRNVHRVEQGNLCRDRVTALLGKIHEVHDGSAQVSNGANRLMLNGVHLLKGVVEDTRSINGLESQHLVVEMSDEQALGCESIGLDIDIRPGDTLQERRLSDVGVTADHQCAGVGVNGWETSQMLSDLLQVDEGVLETLADGGHATKGGALEVLALEQTLAAQKISKVAKSQICDKYAPIFDKSDIVTSDSLNQRLGSVELTKGNPEVVGIVESVEEIAMERVNVLEARETVDGGGQTLGEGLGGVLDFTGVESSYSADLEAGTNLCRKSPLSAQKLAPPTGSWKERESYVRESTMSRNSCDVGTTGMSFH